MQVELPWIRGRVVLVGDMSVGKTSILNRLTENRFNPTEPPTIGANWQLYIRDINGTRVELQIWDTAGEERFRSLGPMYYRNAVGALAVYDITRRDSFEHLQTWINNVVSIATPVTVIVVGNKIDLDVSRQVTYDEAKDWAAMNGYLMFEVSAHNGTNVMTMFEALTDLIASASLRPADHLPIPSPHRGTGCC
jgi:small GTP-binding protein